jgi:hypothetical protein
MAEMLMQQPIPQGQMIGNRYVAPSFTQNLANLANLYVGQRAIEKGDQAQIDLAKAIRSEQNTAVADYLSNIQDKPPTQQKTELAGPYMGNVPQPIAVKDIPAQPANVKMANFEAAQNDRLPAFLRQFAMSEVTKKPKWEKAEYTDEKTGRTRQGVIDVNSPDPISTFQVGGVKPEMDAYQRISLGMRGAELADQGISGYGAPSGGQPMVRTSAPMSNVPVGTSPVIGQNMPQASIASNTPAYAQNALTMPTNANNLPTVPLVNMANVSPKDQRKMAGEQAQTLQANVKNAYDAYPVIGDIEKLLPKASSGYIQRGFTGATRAASISTDMSKADTQLDLLAPKLTMLQPRFEGPQGVLDVKLYESMAGRLADSTLPYEDRLAALDQLKNIYKRYAPNLDWTYSTKQTNASSDSQSKKIAKEGTVQDGPNKGKRAIQYTDGTIEYK